MNTQDRNKEVIATSFKDVLITSFSICGVDGFKTVYAAGGKPEKRMFSALNHMDRMVKEMVQQLTTACETAEQLNDSATAEANQEELNKLKRGQMLINTIRGRLVHQSDMKQLVATGEPQRVTTAQFLAESDWIFKQNITNLLNKLGEIDVGIDKYLADTGQLIATVQKPVMELEPSLCILTGGVFGDRPFYIFMTPLDIQEMGQGDFQKAVQFFVSGALITVKNFRLTDYLRQTGTVQEKSKRDLLRLDEYLDSLCEVKAVKAGSILSLTTTGNSKGKAAIDRVKQTADTLMIESEYRLCDYVLDKLQNIDMMEAVDKTVALLKKIDASDEVAQFIVDPTTLQDDGWSAHPWFPQPYLCWSGHPSATLPEVSKELAEVLDSVSNLIRKELNRTSNGYFIAAMRDEGYLIEKLPEPVGKDRPGKLVMKLAFTAAVETKHGLFGI
jgi:hypothetical protein